ncbi:peptide/nickel transport system substrate-binding protein [Salana multivorans]|uniref:Peptide/nickel transport system substrate-binding protein n=1 Tax=Salana multivorans TaxID=120377 RepID=A0A3N2DDW0_9MICO|nr:ABC transporter substrate-binding protein [Salana multivorans]MBN8880925.1 ABC transporter substrate-binding protein [Salana multivorans]OJX97984.1 MAG: peptide ABC transporter substrate-binding protein [Micrococcales bacterium 73-15]ROR97624.1 peptide/nickel transport system substrate-binding protein [Salana multivorans]
MTRSTGRRRVATLVAAAAGLALLAAGCSTGGSDDPGTGDGTGGETSEGGGDGGAAGGDGATLNIWAGSQTPIKANFNPYIPGFLHATQGPVYEPLFLFNKAAAGDPVPILGESYEFGADGTSMTIKVRSGVTWTDGEDFTAEDVVYSLTNAVAKASYLDSATATDDTTVELKFNAPAFTNESAILQTTILPEHIWKDKTEEELMSWVNETPVGTGPYIVDKVSDASYTLHANEDYWGGAPAVKNLRYLGIDANASAEDLLKAGQIDWTAMFVPDPDSVDMGYVNTPIDPTVLYTCSNADLGCTGAQTDVAVRQALDAAIDRGVIKDKAFVGLTKEISPTFALLGRDDAWIADGMPKEASQSADAAKAASILEAAGYTKGSDGIYEKDGQRVSMKLTSVDGWSDYNDAAKLIEEQAKAAGMEVIASTVSWNEFSDGRQSGNFELIVGGMIGTPVADPFQIYRDWFTTDMTNPVGEMLDAGAWGISRYSNAEVDAAVLAASQTNDDAERLAQYAIIQEHIVNDLPYIPVVVNATQTFFNDKDFTGWPTEDDLYAFPPAWGSNSAGYILSKLQPVG